MTTVRGILVKQFGGPEVLEYVNNIAQPLKPAAKQVFAFVLQFHHALITLIHLYSCLFTIKNVSIIRAFSTVKIYLKLQTTLRAIFRMMQK